MLYVDVKMNETLAIGDVRVTLIQKSGQLARFRVEGDRSVQVSKVINQHNTSVRKSATL